jgi:hypothetical protein
MACDEVSLKFREMIKILTMHNNDTTLRHIGVEPTH